MVYKYKINAYLDSLSHKQYKPAIKEIPRFLGISVNTFHNYRKILINDPQDIPYRVVKQLELLFEMQPGGLKNYELKVLTLDELLRRKSA